MLIPQLVEWLSLKDDDIRYQAFLLLQNRSIFFNDVYPFFDTFCEKLKSDNSYQRSIGLMLYDMDTVLSYPDSDSISDYAKNAALYCQTTGIIAGRAGGVFTPQETATRAEVSAIIQRFVEFVLD